MAVYVDDMYLSPMGNYKGMKMSHLIADTDDELHEMAQKIGIICGGGKRRQSTVATTILL